MNTKSDTPETDGHTRICKCDFRDSSSESAYRPDQIMVRADFARKLERERDKARARVAHLEAQRFVDRKFERQIT